MIKLVSSLSSQSYPTRSYLQYGKSTAPLIITVFTGNANRRLSDIDKDNALSETEFCIAMKLVLMRRKGFDIPTSLPDSLQQEQHEQSEQYTINVYVYLTN